MDLFGQPIWIWLLLIAGSWVAATISAAAGFGGALLLLPLLSNTLGPQAAVPVLTVAQLLGNLSRVGFGVHQIAWRPVAWFLLGAVPASILGARVFVALPREWLMAGIGVVVILVVVARRTRLIKRWDRKHQLAGAGALVGFLSAVAGSAGPLGAAVFLGLDLGPVVYVASEAVTAVAMHVTKAVVYQRYSLIGSVELAQGVILGLAMVAGSWTGKRIIEKLPKEKFVVFVEILLVVTGLQLLLSAVL
ncbi:MAG: sulfite exporter TauE/SafE family protein [Proteobacteria bacterium]|jgi:hypothetical protein|nr:sulfite exporter TauE/SafE family protein [Pseudomonadota bacterium]